MARKKRLDEDAEQVAIYLTPVERLVMDVIGGRRKKRKEDSTSPSEIAADGLWKILTEEEGIAREMIGDLLNVQQPENASNVKAFPKKP